ncbi:PAS domain-containing protein [Sphingobium phenoxybenzoativorans]|uniref:PAS domain-containing protein n=1 Tax=Sphingobium phenoxybenzoativorans TaxID=1592790 RepID=UPI000872BECE|nr:PAS domain-containing protein [Sphingobium phenoxybenzoativorans]
MQSFELLLLENDKTLKSITDFASTLCDTPVALVSFVEDKRQWFPARTGLTVRETPREQSFCAFAMFGNDIMIVPDATHDPRFAHNPLVTGDPYIRFYAGAPLVSEDGIKLGALCVIDNQPRADLTSEQRQGLNLLASHVMLFLTSRRSSRRSDREINEREAKFRVLADAMPQMVWSTRPDGFHDYYNARWYEYTGVEPGSTDGEGWNGMFHPEDQERAWSVWRHSLESGEPYEIEYRLRNAQGEYRWTLGRALPIRDDSGAITRWFGTCTDIHEQKMIQVQREVIAQELSHRIKNIFSVITGLISFSTRHHPEVRSVADDLRDRIMALGRAHDFVRPHSEHSRPVVGQNSLLGMLGELLETYVERVTIDGEDVTIDDRSATPLALVFHELATNAAKYGSLSLPDGQVHLKCRSTKQFAKLEWQEVGGPTVSQPENSGFGTQLIELSAVRQLGGSISREWNPDGLRVELTVPCSSLQRAPVSALKRG